MIVIGEHIIKPGANLTYANLTYANLTDADLTDANLTYANLTHANLRGANLTHANLRGANLTYANLRGADLTHADLTGADLTHADLTGAVGIAYVGFDTRGYVLVRAGFIYTSGCRSFGLYESLAHWGSPDYPDKSRGSDYVTALIYLAGEDWPS